MKKTVSVAPMMDCTDKHEIYFLSLISKNIHLYSEMIGKAITPSERSSQQMINAACTFYDCNIIGKALSLVKRGGSCKVYGSGIGSLTKASFDSQYAVELPSDNREGEISAALLALTGAAAYVSIQVASIANSELHPWATLIGVLIVLSAALDISFRNLM